MKYIKKYFEYNQHNHINILTINESDLFYNFVDYYYNSNLISDNDRLTLEKYTNYSLSNYLINENFFDKLKSRYDKAATVVKNIPDGAKKALSSVIDAAKSSVEFVKNLVKQLNNSISNILNNTTNKIKNKLLSDNNFINAIKKQATTSKDGIIKDMKTCKDVVSFYKTKLGTILSDKLTNGFTQVVTNDDLPIEEKLAQIKENLTMGKNVISSFIHGIEKIPPFNMLHKVKELGEKGANYIIKALSYFTKQMGGQEFDLPVVASLIGIAMEYNIKGLAKHGLLDTIGLITVPVIATLIKTVAWCATFIAAVMVIDDILGLNILSHHNHTEKPTPATAPAAATPAAPSTKPATPAASSTSTPTEPPIQATQTTR